MRKLLLVAVVLVAFGAVRWAADRPLARSPGTLKVALTWPASVPINRVPGPSFETPMPAITPLPDGMRIEAPPESLPDTIKRVKPSSTNRTPPVVAVAVRDASANPLLAVKYPPPDELPKAALGIPPLLNTRTPSAETTKIGRSSSSKWPRTASRRDSRSASRVSALVKMEWPSARAT